jgi:kynurenine formamidase
LEQLFAGEVEVLDLTHALSAGGSFWSSWNSNPFTHDTLAAHPDGSPSMAAYSTPEHNGTHLDAPVHFAAGGRSVDQLTSDDLWGPAVVIDISNRAGANPDALLNVEDIEAWEVEHGPMPDRAIVLLNTGWATKWNDLEAYQNRDADGQMHFPGYSDVAARFLVEQRNIRGIGIDNLRRRQRPPAPTYRCVSHHRPHQDRGWFGWAGADLCGTAELTSKNLELRTRELRITNKEFRMSNKE